MSVCKHCQSWLLLHGLVYARVRKQRTENPHGEKNSSLMIVCSLILVVHQYSFQAVLNMLLSYLRNDISTDLRSVL